MRSVSALAALLGVAAASTAMGQLTAPSVLSSTDNATQPLYVFDITSGAYNPSTVPFGQKITGLAYNQAARRAYAIVRNASTSTRSDLYFIDLNPLGTATFVAQTNGAANSNITSGGLAYDAANSRLIGSAQGRIYGIDPATATLTLLRDFGNGNAINGMDVDPVSGSLYFTQNSTTTSTTISTGRGVYRLDPPFETSAPVKIAAYPIKPAGTGAGAQETDIDGLAAAPGILYLSTDETNSLYRLNLSTLTYDAPIAQPYSPATGAAVGGAAYVGSITDGADVAAAIRTDAGNAIPGFNEYPFVVTIRNVGSQSATAATVSVPLPPGTSFVSATNGAILSGNSVILNAGDLAPNAGATFSMILSSAAAFTATASATTTAADVFAGNDSASVLSSAGAPDLTLTIAAPANCSVAPGGSGTFTINIVNSGSRAVASTLTMPMPPGATYVTSTPPGVPGGGYVGVDLGVIAAGASVPVSVTFTPGEGIYLALTATAIATGDSNPADNTGTAQTVTGFYSSAAIKALISTVAGNTNSTLPELNGDVFTGTYVLDSTRSSNGAWMTSNWKVGTNTSFDLTLVRTNLSTGVSTVMAREGVTTLPGGWTNAFDTFGTPGVNDNGDFGFSGRSNDPTTSTDGYAVKNVGGAFTELARESGPIPSLPGRTSSVIAAGTPFSSGGFTNTGVVYWIGSITGNSTGQDEGAFTDNGNTLLYTRGLTPAGMTVPVTDIINTGFYVSADNTRFIFQATNSTGGTKNYAIVGTVGGSDATAIVSQNVALPGFSSPVSGIAATVMTPEGRWIVRGSNADLEDWVISGTGNTVTPANILVRTGQTAATALPIITGSTELWDPGVGATNNLTGSAANPRGDFVVFGKSLADTRTDGVFVFNGTTVIAREGDPVDANGDGIFNDNMYLLGLNFDDQMVLTNDALYAMVKLRDAGSGANGICTNGSSSAAIALVRIPIPAAGTAVCCRGATCAVIPIANCTDPAGLAGVFSPGGTTCNTNGSVRTPCCYGDFNKVNGVSIQDIFDFLNDWFASSPYARTGSDGSPGPLAVQNIFDFLNAWFTGCN